jgi:hypothetical protein
MASSRRRLITTLSAASLGKHALDVSGRLTSGDRPSLSVTGAKSIREYDVSLLGRNMSNARPDPYGRVDIPFHNMLFNYGVALLDNALLELITDACAEKQRYEFIFMDLPSR